MCVCVCVCVCVCACVCVYNPLNMKNTIVDISLDDIIILRQNVTIR